MWIIGNMRKDNTVGIITLGQVEDKAKNTDPIHSEQEKQIGEPQTKKRSEKECKKV